MPAVGERSFRDVIVGNLAMLATVLSWGSMAPIMSDLMHRLPPPDVAVLRYTVAAPLLIAILMSPIGGPPPRLTDLLAAVPRILALGCLGVVGFAICYTFAIYFAGPIQTAIVNAIAPVIAVAVAYGLTREIPSKTLVIGILVAAPGTVLALSAGNANAVATPGAGTLAIGIALLIAANLCWALYSGLAQRWLTGWSPVNLTAATIACGGILLTALYLGAGVVGLLPLPEALPSRRDSLALAFVAVFGISFGVVCWNLAVRRLGLGLAALYINLLPVVGITVAVLLGATLEPMHVIGAVLIIAGIGGAQIKTLADARR